MKKSMFITKEFSFDAAHKLEWHQGKCKNLHGHSYRLQITIKGDINKQGIVIDFTEIKNIVKEKVIEILDHNYLNKIIKNPTAENIVIWIYDQLKDKLNIHEIKLWETPTSCATYRTE